MNRQQLFSIRASVSIAVSLLSVFTTRLSEAQNYVFHDLYTLGVPFGFTAVNPPCGIGTNGQVVGSVSDSAGNVTAAVWDQAHPSGVSLYPGSYARGTDGSHQVGDYSGAGQTDHAALWSGTAASLGDLNPTAWSNSRAIASSGGAQVGYVFFPDHAAMWSGTYTSFVDLNPAGCPNSWATGAGAGAQVGYGYVGNTVHAFLWHGSAASAMDLNPPGYVNSYALGTDGTQQVGYGTLTNSSGSFYHALLWNGTAASYVELGDREAYAVSGGKQVGFDSTGGVHLAVWSGTASSGVNLSALLPGNLAALEYTGGDTQGPVAVDAQGTIFAIAQDVLSGTYHAVEFVPTAGGSLRILSIQRLANGHILLQCVGAANLTYTIQAASSLTAGFSPAGSATADSGGSFQYEDPTPGTQRFYRLAHP